jgi:hypothetical protein
MSVSEDMGNWGKIIPSTGDKSGDIKDDSGKPSPGLGGGGMSLKLPPAKEEP